MWSKALKGLSTELCLTELSRFAQYGAKLDVFLSLDGARITDLR